MKNFVRFLIVILAAVNVFAHPKLDPEMSSREYKFMLQRQKREAMKQLQARDPHKQKLKDKIKNFFGAPVQVDPVDPEEALLQKWIKIGEKNMQWVDLVNKNRSPDQQISLSSQATQGGISVLNPKIYNYQTVSEDWQTLEALLPATLKNVIFGDAPITATVPVTDREFTEWLFQVDRNYQNTSRYEMNRKYKDEYAQEAVNDVRGYLYLRDLDGLDQKLQGWKDLTTIQKEKLSSSLVQICKNTDETNCDALFDQASKKGKYLDFKNQYFAKAAAHYQSYFQIPQSRPDVTWTSASPNVLQISFTNPHDDKVLHFLQDNIQDEWKWNAWQLQLNFVESTDENTTHVVFEAGATPHVNAVAGSEITMDQNGLLSEFGTQWAIRHEYGHVLGFPDCYLEFYDESVEAFVSYQLDVTNLMCSRRGHFQQVHFDELKRVYFKN